MFNPQPKPERTPPKPRKPLRKVSEKRMKEGEKIYTLEEFVNMQVKASGKKGKLRIEKKKTKAEDYGAWEAFSKMVRIMYADHNGIVKCFTCNYRAYWNTFDCGHGIPRQHKATKYHLMNNHPQDGKCNCFEGGSQAEYAKQVDLKYGKGAWHMLIVLSKTTVKRSKFEFVEMKKFYESEFKRIKKEKEL